MRKRLGQTPSAKRTSIYHAVNYVLISFTALLHQNSNTTDHETMTTSTLSPANKANRPVPLHICGDTTDEQKSTIQKIFADAIQDALHDAIGKIDTRHAQTVLTHDKSLRDGATVAIKELLLRYTATDLYESEEVRSACVYPASYYVLPVEAQVTKLMALFPNLKTVNEKLGRKTYSEEAEGWFVIPRWNALAPTYNEAVALVLEKLAAARKFSNRISDDADKTSSDYLRQTPRSVIAENILADQQGNNDMIVFAGQFGLRYRGTSVRRARAIMAGNEFGLGIFAIACMLLTHPQRMSQGGCLTIDCSGDQYQGLTTMEFDRAPLFDCDLGGLELSLFYEDRATANWGTPSGFLYKM